MMKGRKQLSAKFGRIRRAVRAVAPDLVTAQAERLADLQRALVAVDDGDLKDSIAVTKPGQATPPYSQPGGSRVARDAEALVTAGNSKVRYAHLVEYDTPPHINKGLFEGSKHPGTTAQPFFFPPYRLLRRSIRSQISRGIRKVIRRETKKGG